MAERAKSAPLASAVADPSADGPWPLVGHGTIVSGLWRAARARRLPHALLFHGPAGLGKFRAARALAQGLFCAGLDGDLDGERGPCGVCGPCKRFLSGGHPDLLVVDPPREIDEQIRIGYIVPREGAGEPETSAAAFLSLRPSEGGWRIVIVRRAERMVEQAQNALLKMLEEPGPSVLWILTTDRPARLLSTIRSRSVLVRFPPLTPEQCGEVLAAQGLERAAAERLARWSGGSPGLALAYAERGFADLRKLALAVLFGDLSPWEAAAAVAEVEGRFEGKTPAGRERERARAWIDLAGDLVGDLARRSAGLDPRELRHGDAVEAVASDPAFSATARARLLDEEFLAAAAAELARLRADVELNLDPALSIERAALALGAGSPGVRLAKT